LKHIYDVSSWKH